MRVAVFADIHANLPALEAALRDVRRQACDRIVSIGDAVAIGPFPSETLELLSVEGVTCLKGNHEEYLLDGFPAGAGNPGEAEHQLWTRAQVPEAVVDRVRGWSYEVRLETGSQPVRLLHFARDEQGIIGRSSIRSVSDLQELFGTRGELVVFGHTHVALDVQLVSRYVNPGPLGCGRDEYARYVVIDTGLTRTAIQKRQCAYRRRSVIDAFDRRGVPAREEILSIFYGVDRSR